MRVMVTGGAGFIGSHVVDHALREGHEVAVIDNLSTGRRENVPADARLYEVDVRNRDDLARAMADFGPAAVCHQAAQASVPASIRDPLLDAQINLIGGIHLLDLCVAPGSRVERFVFASTGGAICGEVPTPTRASESAPPRPISPYAVHKLALEQLIATYERYRGLQSTVLRYSNVYGPRQDPHGEAGVIAIFMASIAERRSLRINGWHTKGDDGCLRDYVFVTDVARANVLALSGGIREPIMNVATGVEVSTRRLARELLRLAASDVPFEDQAPRTGDIGRSVLDPTLAASYLGELVSLERGLAETLASIGTHRAPSGGRTSG